MNKLTNLYVFVRLDCGTLGSCLLLQAAAAAAAALAELPLLDGEDPAYFEEESDTRPDLLHGK